MAWTQRGGWILVGVAVGILSGFLGLGGGVVLMPLLLYLGYSPPVATATSLAFMMPTAWASVMKGREHVEGTLAVLLALGAMVGAYTIGQPLVQSQRLEPRLYKTCLGLLLIVVGLDLVTGGTDWLRVRGGTPMAAPAGKRSPPPTLPSRGQQPGTGLASRLPFW